jgi:hypothetical protein
MSSGPPLLALGTGVAVSAALTYINDALQKHILASLTTEDNIASHSISNFDAHCWDRVFPSLRLPEMLGGLRREDIERNRFHLSLRTLPKPLALISNNVV